jgi:hypothetical protein
MQPWGKPEVAPGEDRPGPFTESSPPRTLQETACWTGNPELHSQPPGDRRSRGGSPAEDSVWVLGEPDVH